MKSSPNRQSMSAEGELLHEVANQEGQSADSQASAPAMPAAGETTKKQQQQKLRRGLASSSTKMDEAVQSKQRPREALEQDVSNEFGNQGANRSNDDGCLPEPTNLGSVLVAYEYNLNVMPGTDPLKAVASVDEAMPERIAMELGIWCDDDDDKEVSVSLNRIGGPAGRRSLAAYSSADGIYQLTKGEPDVIRTDVECDSRVFGYDCVPVKASIGIEYDADATNADDASKHLKSYISGLMEHDMIRTTTTHASYVGDRPFDPRPTFGGAGGSGGIVSSTADRTGPETSSDTDGSGGLTTMGKAFIGVFSVLAVIGLAILYKKKRSRRSSDGSSGSSINQPVEAADRENGVAVATGTAAASAAPVKPLSSDNDDDDDDDATLDLDLELSQSRDADYAEVEAEAAEILKDIQRSTGSASPPPSSPGSPGGTLPVVHEGFDPNEEGEV
mmetsp:Transcript_35066/g.76746  ORF Transcript_35066/g.76746 Transcript_35066/m.76746 type:complete len:445 (-) Transcript_35066:128-1462(-)|eukprot:CAMPEP_0178497700 /NCGR_PEP_ID=MMETSP0696-20121128/14836_1 /TAXON_ID=265572 /ORGANISM="Extubocellulus spinifer, Strain CCMP396" /LENGTH=444 /DNA_ID=CAMNT_0020126159 /DNA_START=227 /DNA_END=1561 /DNA_ORIENTATION=+